MFDSGVIGVAIGIVLFFFMLSLVCSGINEAIEAGLRHRAKFLEAGIVDLLGPDLKKRLYDHPLIDALHPRKGRLKDIDKRPPEKQKNTPAYIPADSFSQALATILSYPTVKLPSDIDATTTSIPVGSALGFRRDFLAQIERETVSISRVTERVLPSGDIERELEVERGQKNTQAESHAAGKLLTRVVEGVPEANDVLKDVRASIDQPPAGPLRATLTGFFATGAKQLDDWRAELEGWFDAKMERVSGWYSRRTRLWLLLYAVVVVILLNADTVLVARTLWRDGTLRDSVVAQAEAITTEGNTQQPCPDPQCVVDRLEDVGSLGLPLGWPDVDVLAWDTDAYADDSRVPHSGLDWLLKFFGLALTAGALTMGAPYWFDILNKIGNFRSSGRPPPANHEASVREVV